MLLLTFLAYMGKYSYFFRMCLTYYLYFLLYLCSRLREDLEAAAFDNQSSSLIKLNNGTILYLREVNKFLALVCILREDNFDRQGENSCFYIIRLKKTMISRHNNTRELHYFRLIYRCDRL